MVRMALRGLFARKLRTALTGFAVVIGVAFVAGTFVFTDTINASFKRPLRAGLAGRRRRRHAPSSRSRATSAAGSSRCRRGRWRSRGADRVEGAGAARGNVFDGRTASRIGGNGRRRSSFSTSEERFDPLTYVEGRRRPEAGEVALDKATADRDDFHVGDRLTDRRRAPAKVRPRRHHKLGDQGSLGIASMCSCRCEEVQRIAATPGAITEIAVAATDGTTPEQLKASIARALGGAPRSAPARSRPTKPRRRHHRLARLPHDRAARVRRHRGARRRVPDLQHVRGHGRAALAGVRAAAHARRLAPPGARLGRRRDARDRLRRLGARASSAGLVLAPGLRALLASVGIELPSTGTVIAPRTSSSACRSA